MLHKNSFFSLEMFRKQFEMIPTWRREYSSIIFEKDDGNFERAFGYEVVSGAPIPNRTNWFDARSNEDTGLAFYTFFVAIYVWTLSVIALHYVRQLA